MGFCDDMMLSKSELGLWGIVGALSAVYSPGHCLICCIMSVMIVSGNLYIFQCM